MASLVNGRFEEFGSDMKVVDLSGKTHTLSLKEYQVGLNDTRPRSKGHLNARGLLRKLFPLDVIAEEVPVPGEHLFLDFFLPGRKMVVEVQGEQHDSYTPFFHKTTVKFYQSKGRDRRKAEWCEYNNFKLIELPDNEDEQAWLKRLI